MTDLKKIRNLFFQIADGNEKALRELFETYHNKLGGFVLGWTKSPQIAEEIVLDVFLKIWTNRSDLTSIENPDNYLYVLVRNQTFNFLRQLAKEKLIKEEWRPKFDKLPELTTDTTNEEQWLLIEKAVSKLPPQQHKIYILKKQKGLKYDEIASELNISPETARKHLAAALRNISVFVKKNLAATLFFFL